MVAEFYNEFNNRRLTLLPIVKIPSSLRTDVDES